MSALCPSSIAFSLLVLVSTHAQAETIGDARVGFTAERVLILDGRSFVGRMWHMPGEQRHEQEFPALKPVFILRADKPVGEVVLPQLHTVVEFALPSAAAILSHPDLRRPVGQESIDGITTTQYLVEDDSPEGRATGSLWLSRDGIPIKCVGKFETRNGKLSGRSGRTSARHAHRARSNPVRAFANARYPNLIALPHAPGAHLETAADLVPVLEV